MKNHSKRASQIINGLIGATMTFNSLAIVPPTLAGEMSPQVGPNSFPMTPYALPPVTRTEFKRNLSQIAYEHQFQNASTKNRIATYYLDLVARNPDADAEIANAIRDFKGGIPVAGTLRNNRHLLSVTTNAKVEYQVPKILTEGVDVKFHVGVTLGHQQTSGIRPVASDIITEESGIATMSKPDTTSFAVNAGGSAGKAGVTVPLDVTLDGKPNPDFMTYLEKDVIEHQETLEGIRRGQFDTTPAANLTYEYLKCERPPLADATGDCPGSLTIAALNDAGFGQDFMSAPQSDAEAENYIKKQLGEFFHEADPYQFDIDQYITRFQDSHGVGALLGADIEELHSDLSLAESDTFRDPDAFDHAGFQKKLEDFRGDLQATYQIASLFAKLAGNEKLGADIAKTYQVIEAAVSVAVGISGIIAATSAGAMFGPAGMAAGGIIGLISAFSSSGGGDNSSRILQAIQDLNIRFDQIQDSLIIISSQLDSVLQTQQAIIGIVLDNAYYLRLNTSQLQELKQQIIESFKLTQQDIKQLDIKIERLSDQVTQGFDNALERDREMAFSNYNTTINLLDENPDGRSLSELIDFQIRLRDFMTKDLHNATFSRPLADDDSLNYPQNERTSVLPDMLDKAREILAAAVSRKERGILNSYGDTTVLQDAQIPNPDLSIPNSGDIQIPGWYSYYTGKISDAANNPAHNLPHPDFFLYFYKRYAQLGLEYQNSFKQDGKPVFDINNPEINADLDAQEKTVTEFLKFLPPATTILKDDTARLLDRIDELLINGQDQYMTELSKTSTWKIQEALTKASNFMKTISGGMLPGIPEDNIKYFFLTSDAATISAVVSSLSNDQLVEVATIMDLVERQTFTKPTYLKELRDLIDRQEIDGTGPTPEEEAAAVKEGWFNPEPQEGDEVDVYGFDPDVQPWSTAPYMDVYDEVTYVQRDNIIIEDGMDPDTYGIGLSLYAIRPGRINHMNVLKIVPHGTRFTPYKCVLPEGTVATPQQLKLTSCFTAVPMSYKTLSSEEIAVMQLYDTNRRIVEFLSPSPYLLAGGFKYYGDENYRHEDVLSLKKYQSPYNLQLTKSGLDYWESMKLPITMTDKSVLFPIKYEEWETIDNPSFETDAPDSPRHSPTVLSTKTRLPTERELQPFADNISALRAMVILDIQDRQKDLQQKISTLLSKSDALNRIVDMYPVMVTASEWGLGECLYTNPVYDPYEFLVDARFPTADGNTENFAEMIQGLTTTKDPTDFMRRYSQLRAFNNSSGINQLPTTDVYIGLRNADGEPMQFGDSTSEEIDPAALYASSDTCNLGQQSVREAVEMRDFLRPPTP